MQYERILALGDIHGRFDRLSSVFNKLNFDTEKDFLILLGDYIDRGNENLHCLQWAMQISKLPNIVALRGNHEQMMLYYYLMGTYESTIWLPNGGNRTKAEMDEWLKHDPDFLKRALQFIDKRPYYYQTFIEGQEYIFCHAGLKPGISLENQTVESILWIREEFYNGYNGTAEVVVGHTPTPYLGNVPGVKIKDRYYPVRLPNKITMIDTGSFLPSGRISCIDVISGQIWQSDN
ncbi:MAG: metallophosphoesterase [Selenomonadaceae bacterium]|nr:metallophosphoesterase [Selenomonadaceae bacterium]